MIQKLTGLIIAFGALGAGCGLYQWKETKRILVSSNNSDKDLEEFQFDAVADAFTIYVLEDSSKMHLGLWTGHLCRKQTSIEQSYIVTERLELNGPPPWVIAAVATVGSSAVFAIGNSSWKDPSSPERVTFNVMGGVLLFGAAVTLGVQVERWLNDANQRQRYEDISTTPRIVEVPCSDDTKKVTSGEITIFSPWGSRLTTNLTSDGVDIPFSAFLNTDETLSSETLRALAGGTWKIERRLPNGGIVRSESTIARDDIERIAAEPVEADTTGDAVQIDTFSVSPPVLTEGSNARLHIALHNTGVASLKNITLRIKATDLRIQQSTFVVTLPPGMPYDKTIAIGAPDEFKADEMPIALFVMSGDNLITSAMQQLSTASHRPSLSAQCIIGNNPSTVDVPVIDAGADVFVSCIVANTGAQDIAPSTEHAELVEKKTGKRQDIPLSALPLTLHPGESATIRARIKVSSAFLAGEDITMSVTVTDSKAQSYDAYRHNIRLRAQEICDPHTPLSRAEYEKQAAVVRSWRKDGRISKEEADQDIKQLLLCFSTQK